MTEQSIKRELRVDCDLRRLKQVRAFVCDACRSVGASEEVMYDLQLAASELAANIMRHALGCDSQTSFSLEVDLSPRTATLTFVHDGIPFDPATAQVPAPTFDGTRDHGFGLFLINKVMDQSSYTQTPDGRNRVVLKRRLG